MTVTVVQAHSLDRGPHIAPHALFPPVLADKRVPLSLSSQHATDKAIDQSLPTPVSPNILYLESPQSYAQDSEAGPSRFGQAIPPPPNPRRHRSGLLMSRVRAASSAASLKPSLNMTSSKSVGDLNEMGMDADDDEDKIEGLSTGRGRWNRVVSEGSRDSNGEESEDTMWDNSARFYHHMHSRPASRSVSQSTSPSHSPVSAQRLPLDSIAVTPIYVRRSLTLPQNASGAPLTPGIHPATLSPNHQFLQAHLPPTFPFPTSPGSNSETMLENPGAHPMVILTPTTQEWRELKELRRMEGDENDSDGETSSSEEERSQSGGSDASSSILLRPEPSRPVFRATMSAEFFGDEAYHRRHPGSSVADEYHSPPDGGIPTFNPVIIAPSPVFPSNDQVPVQPETPTRDSMLARSPRVALGDEDPTSGPDNKFDFGLKHIQQSEDDKEDSPIRFASVGRRESLRTSTGKEEPLPQRKKTKRELERERLFKDLDETLEAEADQDQDVVVPSASIEWGTGVQAIGLRSLETRPGSAEPMLEGRSINDPTEDYTEFKRISLPLPSRKQHLSPTQPMRSSPLHASPLNAIGGLPTPPSETIPSGEVSISVTPPRKTPSPKQAINLMGIRDFARNVTPPHITRINSPSPPQSPRLARRRDVSRVSLVAGRVVQPFIVPPSTSLPPPDHVPISRKPSLQSFSPFRAPQSDVTRPTGGIPNSSPGLLPGLARWDSSLSFAPSTGAPSECGTPTSETAGGLGGRGIHDYVIFKEAGKGAYGLVMRAKVKGASGEPIGDEVIIKYIIKARILADCWKKHRTLGPIPVEIHVMDQLRHLLYNPPTRPHPWDPARCCSNATMETGLIISKFDSGPNTPDSARSSPRSENSMGMFSPVQKYIAHEIKSSPQRGHPNICKLLDFFEDKEFYYLVMPRFGTGVDLFDRVESQPAGLGPFEVRSLIGQLADAIRFLHANGIVHRDIKDENVILDGAGRCSLIDFGSAAHWRPGKRWDTFSGTLHYASPEILRGEMYGGKEQDVWALGVVAYVLLVGETPFADLPDEVLDGLGPESRAEKALEARCGGSLEDEGLEEDGGGRLGDAADIVRSCLAFDIGDRPNADIVCHHRFLKGEGGWSGRRGWVAMGLK